MQGFDALWMPGTDHAGIATQNVVERKLAAEGTDRHALGREAFIQRVWQWKAESGGQIINQLKRLGASCDWSRERFTLDEGLSRAVREVFVRLYEEGLIYKGDYIINWCPRCRTALADLEVEHDPHDGHLYHIRYPLADGDGHLTVATTRPETLLGDTAVAVNPEDKRYLKFHGATLRLPVLGREIPVITDSYVSLEFGTGALKITPAHDFNDFEVARRHDLPAIQVIDEGGNMTKEAGPKYVGMDRFVCREQIVKDLKKLGLLDKVEPYQVPVGHCYRCKVIVEPLVSKQWFVAVKTLAAAAIAAVQDGRTKLIPANWDKSYFDWMNNIRDWCISRQIWWGHRIPAWTCQSCGEVVVSREDPAHCPKCGGGRAHPGDRRPGHLVLFGPVALFHPGLAGPDPGAQALLPHQRPGHRLRHPLFLGGPHDDDGDSLHGRGALPGGLHPRPGAGRRRPQDEQIQGQRRRSPGPDERVRHRRLPLLPGRLRRHGPGRAPQRGPHRRLPQLRQQGLERLPLHPDEPGGLQ